MTFEIELAYFLSDLFKYAIYGIGIVTGIVCVVGVSVLAGLFAYGIYEKISDSVFSIRNKTNTIAANRDVKRIMNKLLDGYTLVSLKPIFDKWGRRSFKFRFIDALKQKVLPWIAHKDDIRDLVRFFDYAQIKISDRTYGPLKTLLEIGASSNSIEKLFETRFEGDYKKCGAFYTENTDHPVDFDSHEPIPSCHVFAKGESAKLHHGIVNMSITYRRPELAKFFIQKGAPINSEVAILLRQSEEIAGDKKIGVLCNAVMHEYWDLALFLLEKGARASTITYYYDKRSYTGKIKTGTIVNVCPETLKIYQKLGIREMSQLKNALIRKKMEAEKLNPPSAKDMVRPVAQAQPPVATKLIVQNKNGNGTPVKR